MTWPEAAVSIAGIVLVIAVVVVAIHQIFATARARMSVQREAAYRQLAEEATAAQRQAAERLEQAAADLAEVRARTAELERILKEVG